jgi:hypothetical protein
MVIFCVCHKTAKDRKLEKLIMHIVVPVGKLG